MFYEHEIELMSEDIYFIPYYVLFVVKSYMYATLYPWKEIVYSEDVFQWLCYIIWKKRGCNNKRIIDYAGKDIQSYVCLLYMCLTHWRSFYITLYLEYTMWFFYINRTTAPGGYTKKDAVEWRRASWIVIIWMKMKKGN